MQVAAKRVKDSLDQLTKSIKKINKSIQYNSRENGIIYRKACEI
jgi:prefoldin subunit 5